MVKETLGLKEKVMVSIAGLAGLGSLALIAGGCSLDSYSTKGKVELGANGKAYIIPNGAERPIYGSLKACETDVAKQIKNIEKQSGNKVKETAAQLCQPVSSYPTTHAVYVGQYYGPIVDKSAVWKSSNVVDWQKNIPSGTFASSEMHIQSSIEVAPKGATVGETVSANEYGAGFGETGETGYHGGSFGDGGGEGGGHVVIVDGGK